MKIEVAPIKSCGRHPKDMGASSSTTNNMINDTENFISNTCEHVSAVNQFIYAPLNIVGCSNVSVSLKNVNADVFNCSIDTSVTSTIKSFQSTTSVTQAGVWGFADSDTTSNVTNIIRNVISNTCGTTNQIKQTIDSAFNCDHSQYINMEAFNQNAATANCLLATVVKNAITADSTVKSTTKSWDPMGMIIIVIIIIVFIVVAAIVMKILKK